jgi:hypothetical protein
MRLVTYTSNRRSSSGDREWHAGIAVDDKVINPTAAANASQLFVDSCTLRNLVIRSG